MTIYRTKIPYLKPQGWARRMYNRGNPPQTWLAFLSACRSFQSASTQADVLSLTKMLLGISLNTETPTHCVSSDNEVTPSPGHSLDWQETLSTVPTFASRTPTPMPLAAPAQVAPVKTYPFISKLPLLSARLGSSSAASAAAPVTHFSFVQPALARPFVSKLPLPSARLGPSYAASAAAPVTPSASVQPVLARPFVSKLPLLSSPLGRLGPSSVVNVAPRPGFMAATKASRQARRDKRPVTRSQKPPFLAGIAPPSRSNSASPVSRSGSTLSSRSIAPLRPIIRQSGTTAPVRKGVKFDETTLVYEVSKWLIPGVHVWGEPEEAEEDYETDALAECF